MKSVPCPIKATSLSDPDCTSQVPETISASEQSIEELFASPEKLLKLYEISFFNWFNSPQCRCRHCGARLYKHGYFSMVINDGYGGKITIRGRRVRCTGEGCHHTERVKLDLSIPNYQCNIIQADEITNSIIKGLPLNPIVNKWGLSSKTVYAVASRIRKILSKLDSSLSTKNQNGFYSVIKVCPNVNKYWTCSFLLVSGQAP